MLLPCLVLGLLVDWVQSICTGTLYWNPLNNACVAGNWVLMQNVLGILRTCTTETPRPTSAW